MQNYCIIMHDTCNNFATVYFCLKCTDKVPEEKVEECPRKIVKTVKAYELCMIMLICA